MKNNDYWKKRYQQLEESTHNKSLKLIEELKPEFDKTLKEIDNNIAKWYQRIANNNELSLKDAKKLLKDSELKEFHWTVEEYIKYGKENAINQKWLKELENASAKYHITKLEAQKIEVRQKVEELFNKEYQTVNKVLKSGYKDSFYKSCYELEKGLNVGKSITKLDSKTLDKIISKPWTADGNNFSDRIWNSKTDLIDTIHKELTRMYTLGEAPDKTIKNISKKFNVSKAQAGRLVQTEMSYFNALADKESYERLGVKQIEIDATLDSTTCSACGSLDGTVIDLKDYEIGVNIPPYHPNCRCTSVPWFEDEFDSDERIARSDDGKQYYISSDMKYSEWKEKYLIDKEAKRAVKTKAFIDVTTEWLNKSKTNGKIINRDYFVDKQGNKYIVDNKNVVLDPSQDEIEMAEFIKSTFGGNVYINPKVNVPENIESSDYLWNNQFWDKKCIGKTASSLTRAVDNALKAHKEQADYFILDISDSIISRDILIEQTKKIFSTKGREWIKGIMVVDKKEVIGIYIR